MTESQQGRAVLGFCSVAVFGRSVTLALQHLRTWDKAAFETWYAPWLAEMSGDPLRRFFYEMRTEILHGGVPNIAVTLFGAGVNAPKPGTIRIMNRSLPTQHRGNPIEDNSTLNFCRLYVAYLEEMITSVGDVVLQIHDRWSAEYQATISGS